MTKEITLNYEIGSSFSEKIMGGVFKTSIREITVTVYKDLTPSDHRIGYTDSLGNFAGSDSSYLDLIEKATKYKFDPLFEIGEKGYVYNGYMGGGKLCLEEVRGYKLFITNNKVDIHYLTHSSNDETGIFKTPELFLEFITRDLK